MTNNVEPKKNNNLFKVIYIISYILLTFLIGTLFMLLFAVIIANVRGENTHNVINFLTGNKDIAYTDLERDCAYTAQGYGNALSYMIMFVLAIILLFPEFKEDLFSFKENKRFFIPYTLIASVLFVGLAFLISWLIGFAVKDSENQKTIVAIMKTKALVPMIISTVIFAPVVEEAIYRKLVFHYTPNQPMWARYLISIVLFVLPHVTTSIGKFGVGEYFLMIIPYLTSAFMLAFIYHKGKFNIYTSIICHLLNNVLAIILVFI